MPLEALEDSEDLVIKEELKIPDKVKWDSHKISLNQIKDSLKVVEVDSSLEVI